VIFAPAAAYTRQMTRTRGLVIVAVAALASAASGCGNGSSSTPGRAHADAIVFSPSTPAWIVSAATATANDLDDPNATVVSVSLGARPVVVLAGRFTCKLCSRPGNSTPVQAGTYAAIRYDGATRQGTDFGLAGSKEQALGSLCNGGGC
jgi:hypothetical protein